MMPRKYFLFFIFLFLSAAPVFAADLVNINTADLATLETLPGVGASIAQSIIDNRPYAAIEEVSRAAGIGEPGSSSYEKIKNLITVGSTPTSQTQTQTQTQDQSTTTQTQTVQSTGGVGPPPITAEITTDAEAVAGAGTVFAGEAFGTKGEPLLSGVRYVWNFGDGGVAEGARVLHTYEYPGVYDVQLSVGYNYSSATARLVLPAVAAEVTLIAEGDGSLTIVNRSGDDLDVGFWSLLQGSSTPFVVPEGTIILRGKGVRFSPAVLRFAGDERATLNYPNGAVAAGAAVGMSSPLRGEQVSFAPAVLAPAAGATVKAPAQKVSAINSTDQPAAVAMAGPASKEVQWSYLVGLVAIIALGTVGTYYAYTPRRAVETGITADEFDIE